MKKFMLCFSLIVFTSCYDEGDMHCLMPDAKVPTYRPPTVPPPEDSYVDYDFSEDVSEESCKEEHKILKEEYKNHKERCHKQHHCPHND